jgi:hypothetical protein
MYLQEKKKKKERKKRKKREKKEKKINKWMSERDCIVCLCEASENVKCTVVLESRVETNALNHKLHQYKSIGKQQIHSKAKTNDRIIE